MAEPIEALSRVDAPGGYQQVVNYIAERLMDGSLKVGDRLLPERELSIRLNVSRPMVREALRSLAMIGVLEIRQGHGTFVRTPDVSSFADLFMFAIAQHGSVIDEILEVRIALERQAIRLACKRARPKEIARIAAAFAEIVDSIDDPLRGGHADFRFHTAIVEASHSPAIINIYRVVSDMLLRSHVERRSRLSDSEAYRDFLIAHHRRILSAIERQDAEESEALLLQHFEIGAEFP